jgi:hypothetical protein
MQANEGEERYKLPSGSSGIITGTRNIPAIFHPLK